MRVTLGNLLPSDCRFHRAASFALLGNNENFRSHFAYLLSALLAIASALAFAIDAHVAGFCLGGNVADWVEKPLVLSEAFAHSFGVVAILIAVLLLDERRRRATLRLAVCALGGGLLANVVKLTIGRLRPKLFDLSKPIFESFVGWFPWQDNLGNLAERGIQSFPSAHTATAAGLAVALVWLYPRARWLFVALAIMSAGQRVVASAHFVSDVFAGAALGCLFAAVCTDRRLLGRLFDRFEKRAGAECRQLKEVDEAQENDGHQKSKAAQESI